MTCTHPLCALVGDATCAIVVQRSRGCHASAWSDTVAPEVFAEVRALLARLPERDAAARLAQLVRHEALEGRNLVAHAHADEPELAGALAQLVGR